VSRFPIIREEADRVTREEHAAGHTVGWIIVCPHCGHHGTPRQFDESCASECFCPKCDGQFEFQPEDEDGEDDE
jgi:transcription initiation factor IIE alpha subunit